MHAKLELYNTVIGFFLQLQFFSKNLTASRLRFVGKKIIRCSIKLCVAFFCCRYSQVLFIDNEHRLVIMQQLFCSYEGKKQQKAYLSMCVVRFNDTAYIANYKQNFFQKVDTCNN